MLESLRRGAGNIHQLNLEGAFPEPVKYRPRELYEELKRTPLYDVERGQWNFDMSKEDLPDTDRVADAQLLGALVEALFSPEGARALYEKLKATPLYDASRKQWNCDMSEEQELGDSYRDAAAQLLGVLVEVQLNPEGARALYEKLKATPLYDAQLGQWRRHMSKEQELLDADRYASAQLLGVLVEAKLLAALPRPLLEAIPPPPITEDW